MALFNDSDLIVDLNTIISGLTLATEEDDRLVVLLKAAQNLGEDPTTVISELQSRIEAIDDTVLLEKFAILVGGLTLSTTDRIVSVATVDDLQNLETDPLPSGTIFFVDSIGVEVVAVGKKWLGLDGRLLRNDEPPPVVAMSWGSGFNGRLGDGTTVSKSSPVTVVGDITSWSTGAAAQRHSVGITEDGIAYAWGRNDRGNLGDGTNIDKSSPVTVIGDITNWSAIAADGYHNLGLTDTGVLYAWGQNRDGRLGDNTRTDRSSPVTVVGGITNWSAVSVAGTSSLSAGHSLALTDTGVLYAWGLAGSGQLGDNQRFFNRSSPVTVVGGITNWSRIATGAYHNLGLTDAGVLYAWGNNNFGQLGDGTTDSRSSPVTVVGGITNWSAIAGGRRITLAVTDAGVLYAWGINSAGGLGDGTTINKSSPVTVIGGITNWSTIASGTSRSFAVTDTGIAYAWGSGYAGALGDGTTVDKSSPVTVVGGISSWTYLDAGDSHIFALKTGA